MPTSLATNANNVGITPTPAYRQAGTPSPVKGEGSCCYFHALRLHASR